MSEIVVELPEKDICISCGKEKRVCCNYAFTDEGKHIDPVCVDCCKCTKNPIWQGKCVGGGIYEYCGSC